jgi:cytoskeletal protein RodZ
MISSGMTVLPVDLIAWRTRNGISLAAVAAATKISPRYLEAIERGTFRSLPGGVYNLNYIRQYAQAIHYEEEGLLAYYRSIEPACAPPPEARPTWFSRTFKSYLSAGILPAFKLFRVALHPRK